MVHGVPLLCLFWDWAHDRAHRHGHDRPVGGSRSIFTLT
ncbi:hypothetical protein PCLA_03r0554 [Pseudomonas citronellolis]|nr:hypothetical protein PCLA_03r0554 [Pseudomonas citronellolis]